VWSQATGVVTGPIPPPLTGAMTIEHSTARHDSHAAPSGADALAVRERYLHHRRRVDDRGWITIWVTVFAVMGWLFLAGMTGLGH
jgi:hypothetical protein